MMFGRTPLLCTAVLFINWSLPAQSVVSVRAGIVHYFEGSVSIDGQQLQSKFGRFYEIKDGSQLRTGDGRAEVLLTPGVLLRVDRNSSIRMLSSRLADTRVEFVGGSAVLDSTNAASAGAVSIVYKDYRMHSRVPGVYRLNSVPAELAVEHGEAEVVSGHKSVVVAAGQELPFTPALEAHTRGADRGDGFDLWASDRNQSVAADNAAAADSDTLTTALQKDPPAMYDAGLYGIATAPVFAPAPDLMSGSLAWPSNSNPYMYRGMLFRNNYIPLYGPRVGVGAFRPLTPIRVMPSRPLQMWHPPMRTGPPAVMRAPASPGAAGRRGAGHR